MAEQTPSSTQIYEMTGLPMAIANLVHSYLGNPFTIVLNVKKTFTIPVINSKNGVIIHWGDGSIDTLTENGSVRHTFSKAGEYVVQIFGIITELNFRGVCELIKITQWGELQLAHFYQVFYGCKNLLLVTAVDKPKLDNVSTLFGMFEKCKSLKGGNFNHWDVGNITNMAFMFSGCKKFNADISKWNVKNVTNMAKMFSKCHRFNSNLSEWNVENVFNMQKMFKHCYHFNSDLSNWNIMRVSNMFLMFYCCMDIDFDFSRWGISKVKNTNLVFHGSKLFKSNKCYCNVIHEY